MCRLDAIKIIKKIRHHGIPAEKMCYLCVFVLVHIHCETLLVKNFEIIMKSHSIALTRHGSTSNNHAVELFDPIFFFYFFYLFRFIHFFFLFMNISKAIFICMSACAQLPRHKMDPLPLIRVTNIFC